MAQAVRQSPSAGSKGGRVAGGQLADQVAAIATFPIEVARRVLPDQELPVYLGVGALAVVGAFEWPVALGAVLGYAALRRWGPPKPTPKPGPTGQ
jgi:hypothetical protein